ncbi:MAG: GTPase ObgE, partial [bacterium]
MGVPKTFVDEATITVKAGDGGNGAVTFLREKFQPRGGPSGGDGGKGGDVYMKVATGLITLEDFRHQRHFKAQRGADGISRNMHGKDGKDLIIPVPPGTIAFNAETGDVIADLAGVSEKVMIAVGGGGGLGNQHFATAKNQAPRHATKGIPGVELVIHLELRLLADVGLVGFPNAGKSTFLNRVSNAKPRIASYPFTTLRPSVGIVRVGDFHQFTMADIPGIIEEAHAGKGLGLQFLRHIARTRILCHLIAVMPDSAENIGPLVEQYKVILEELTQYDPALLEKPRITVLNKIDVLLDPGQAEEVRRKFQEATGCPEPLFTTSTQHDLGLETLVLTLQKAVQGDRDDPHA